jgi:rare lipoprotein A (peptidoglycan hydrolase)
MTSWNSMARRGLVVGASLGVAAMLVGSAGARTPHYKIGSPYQIGGKWYYPKDEPNYDRIVWASWYGGSFHKGPTANGETYDMWSLTAAHPTLPLPSYAYVTNIANGRKLLLRINNRGPFVGNRQLDLSVRAAKLLGTYDRGVAKVRLQYVGRAPLDKDDWRERQFLVAQSWYTGPGATRLAKAPDLKPQTPKLPLPAVVAEAPKKSKPTLSPLLASAPEVTSPIEGVRLVRQLEAEQMAAVKAIWRQAMLSAKR